jgi:hypothetical protein
METKRVYKSFNSNKSLEELLYGISNDSQRLTELKIELQYYATLIDKPIFIKNVMNLFEKLSELKNDIIQLEKTRIKLLIKVKSHINLISNKIVCQDTVCDIFFIDAFNQLEKEIFHFDNEIFNFKRRYYEYIEGVILQ